MLDLTNFSLDFFCFGEPLVCVSNVKFDNADLDGDELDVIDFGDLSELSKFDGDDADDEDDGVKSKCMFVWLKLN